MPRIPHGFLSLGMNWQLAHSKSREAMRRANKENGLSCAEKKFVHN
jgi:hypothetical protein